MPEIANNVPHVLLEWQEDRLKLSFGGCWCASCARVIRRSWSQEKKRARFEFRSWMMQGDEHRIVAERLKEIFTQVKV